MAKFISGRQPQLNVGVSSSTENKTSLQVTGKVGIGTTNADGRSLYVFGDAEVTGVTTANRFSTGPSGVGFNIFDNKITGPSEIIIDPAGVGVNTGSVRIKGDLFVDGTQTVIDSTKIELADFNVGIASTVASNVLLDGAGIGIGSENIRKNFTYDYSSDSLKSSENFDVAENKVYKVNEVERLSFNRLQVPHADITGIATAAVFRVTGVSTFDGLVDANGGAEIDNVRIGVTDNNEIDTSTGNLTIDSDGGNVIIDDHLNVVGVSTLYNTTHDNELIYRSNGQLRIIGGGPQTTRNNILFTNGGGLIIDAGSSETAGLTLKGGGGPVRFTQGRVGIETQTPQSTLDVNGDLRVVGFTTLIGYVDIDSSVDINQKLNVGSGLTVGGYADFNDAVDILKSLVVGGGTTIGGYTDINAAADISGSLTVGGGTTIGGYTDINAAADISGSLTVGGGTTIGGYVDINNSVDISQKLNVGSGLTVGGYVDINNSVDISNNLNVVGIVTALRFESNQSGLSNFFAGTQAGGAITAGLVDYNVIIGYQAGYDLNGSSYNVAIGYQSLYSTNNSFATGNVAIGYQSLYSTATSDYLVAIGYRAGYYATDVYNSVFIGAYAASNQNVSGNQNVAIGQYSGYNLSTGYFNTFIGGFNGYTNLVTGYQNVALGNNSLYSISSGYDNVVIGQNAGLNITTGYRNILIGRGAAQNSSSIAGNTIIGYSAGSVSDSGDYNVIIGYESGYNAEDDFGTFIGYRAGYNAIDAYASVYIGAQAGYTASGDTNIGIGWDAMYAHDGGGQYNIALGYQSLYNDGASSNWNIAIGYQAGYGSTNTTGSLNILLGYQAGFNLTSGSSNVILGNYGGDSITSGSSNVVIVGGNGSTVDVPISTGSNQLVIGSDATAWIYGNSSYNVGLGTTNPTQKLDVVGNIKLSGAIHGPTELVIDPRTVGDNTGSVRIKGDLYVDGTNFIVNSSTIELKDFQVGIASDIATNVLLDGAGIGIGSTNIRKTLTYDYSSDSLKSSEHFDLAANKTYKINEVEVLRDTQLTIPNAYVSGLGTITQLSGTNLTYTNADIDNAYITAGIVTTIGGTNLSYTIAGINTGFVNSGVVTTIRGTDASYDNFYGIAGIVTTLAGTNLTYTTGNLGIGNIVTGVVTTIRGTDASYDNFYGIAGIVTTIAGTNLTYTNADIDNAYVTTGIVTTIQGTDASYSNFYGVAGIVTTIAGTNLTYATSDIDNAYVTTGIVTTIRGTDASYTNAYVNVGVVTTLSGTNLTYTNISNVGGISTLGVTSTTKLTTQLLDVSGVSTFRSNVQITTGDFLYFGDNNDFSILFGGSQTFITQNSSYPITIAGNTAVNINVNGAESAIIATANGSVDLYYDNSKKFETTPGGVVITGGINATGVVTATQFHTGASGSAIRINSNTITGPSEITIDPAGVGDNTGSVRIKGNLYVDGTNFIVDSSTIELKDFQIGIATDISTNVLLDGAGIGIGSTNIRKTLTYDYSSDSLKSSEHFDLSSNKTYKINEVEVLRDTQLTIPNAYVSGLGTITQLSGTNLTYTNADIDNAYVTTGIVTTIQGTDASYTNLYVNSGIVTNLVGTSMTYVNAEITNLTINSGVVSAISGTDLTYFNLYAVTGIVTTLAGTNLTYATADIDNAYVTTGIVTTIAGTNLTYATADIDNAYVTTGIVTTIAGTNLTYSTADIDNAYITSGIITSITNTYLTSGIATITTIYGDFDGELNAPGKSWYVSTNGSDSHTGDNINQPFASLAYAVGIATSGDTIFVGAGTFTEVFPMTIPVGVAIKGAGIRGTFIQPTAGTKQNDCFLMNGETTVEDLSIGNFFEPGYAFKFANNCKTTTRSPYIQRVTVLNKGSVTTTADPYGFDTPHSPPSTYKAGRGVLIDGSVCDATTLEAAMLFNECTFICPNNNALEMTNGGRSEWVNCFTYFADKGIYAYDGNVGLGSTGYVRLKTSGITTSTSGFPTTNDEVYYLEANSQSGTYVQVGTGLTITRVGHGLTIGDRIFADFTTGTASDGFYRVTGYVGVNTFSVTMAGSATTSGNVSYKEALGFGTVTAYNTSSGLSSIFAKGEGLFELPSSRVAKTVTAYGNASLSTAQKQFGTASLALDGNGDYVQVASNTDFEYGTGDFTIELWFYPNNFSTFQVLVDQRISAPDNTAYIDVTPTTGLVRYTVASTTITANTALNVTNWNHIAISRSSGTTRMFINGTLQSSTISDSTNYVTAPLRIGGDYASNPYWVNGYIDEVRITKGTSRYSATFTPSTSAFNSDGNDKLLLHFDGITGSTSFIDSSIATQDIRWVRGGIGIATATRITLADYQQFGGDMRSIGSAAVFGNTGVTADGPGSTLRLFAFNFGHIGSGKDFTQDVSLVNQAAEVTTTNNGSVYFASIDQGGDFRVGDAFYVNQEAGTVNFGGQDFTITSLSDLNISDGNNTTIITPTTLTVGNIQIFGNEITTTSGDITINPSGTSEINIIGNVNISGILTATIAAVDSIQLGDTSITVDDTGSNGTIRFNTDNVEAMRVTNLQRVGIGSDVPTSKLDVGGDVKVIGVVTATTAFDTTYTKTGSITATTNTTSQTTIHSGLASASYRSVEYLIQATEGTSFHTTKILVVHDGTNAYLTEYGSVFNGATIATYDVDIFGGNLRLLATPASTSSTTFKVSFTSIVI